MIYLLDTNICIYALNRSDPALIERLRRLRRTDLAVSSVSVAELLYGAARSARPEANERRALQFVEALTELGFDHAAASAYGALRARLAAAGRSVGAMDLLIAATATANGCVLVTNDRRAFERVPGLAVENWATSR